MGRRMATLEKPFRWAKLGGFALYTGFQGVLSSAYPTGLWHELFAS